MVTAERQEEAEFGPAGQQFPAGVSIEAADVHACPGHAGEAEIEQLGNAHRQVFPA